MEPNENRQKNAGRGKAAIVGTGIVCGFVGAVVGAVGYYLWKKEEDLKLQMHKHKDPDKVYNEGTCPICLAEMEELTVLDCGHQYHKTCTKNLKDAELVALHNTVQWRHIVSDSELNHHAPQHHGMNTPKCPICRKKIDA